MMQRLLLFVALLLGLSLSAFAQAQQSKLPPCPAVDYSKNTHGGRTEKWHNCFGRYVAELNDAFKGDVIESEFRNGMTNGQGTYTYANGGRYVGEFKDFMKHGQGTFTTADGSKYVGEYKNGKPHGQGTATFADGGPAMEGIWSDGKFVRAEKVNLPPVKQQTDVAINEERRKLDADRQALELERQRLTEERNRREQAKQSSKLSLQTTTTNPDANGVVIINVRTNADTSSLKVNGEEQGGRPDGNYVIKKVARVGQDTNYVIAAVDTNGNTDSTTITVARQAVSQSSNQSASLKPENIKRAPARDAVAIIIGIQNYKRVPKAEFANSDAKEFYEYAIRGLGIKPENIKLLLDEEADEVELYKAFQNWLPLQVTKNKTDVFVFYSGHGLPAPDGKSLYFLPHGVDKQFIEKTAVSQQEVIAALVASKPKSVTMFIDACYSGQTRSGEMMIASVRPLAVKSEVSVYPSNFTVISASSNDQYSSSSPELKHGIFSFYLMKGMEGDADGNKDGKITAGEMQEYLSDKVSRQAMSMSRKQDTQLVGDANRVLMGR
ncbi:Caspase domain containing protein [Oxalobacteraceae bacterium]